MRELLRASHPPVQRPSQRLALIHHSHWRRLQAELSCCDCTRHHVRSPYPAPSHSVQALLRMGGCNLLSWALGGKMNVYTVHRWPTGHGMRHSHCNSCFWVCRRVQHAVIPVLATSSLLSSGHEPSAPNLIKIMCHTSPSHWWRLVLYASLATALDAGLQHYWWRTAG